MLERDDYIVVLSDRLNSGSKMVVYGGADAHHQFNDVWMLDLVNYTWQELRPSNLSEPPPPVEALQEQHFRAP